MQICNGRNGVCYVAPSSSHTQTLKYGCAFRSTLPPANCGIKMEREREGGGWQGERTRGQIKLRSCECTLPSASYWVHASYGHRRWLYEEFYSHSHSHSTRAFERSCDVNENDAAELYVYVHHLNCVKSLCVDDLRPNAVKHTGVRVCSRASNASERVPLFRE